MPLSDDALISLAELKTYLKITGNEADTFLESLIEATSSNFNNFTDRLLMARDYHYDPESVDYDPINAILDGCGQHELLLPQYPVASVSQVMLDKTVVPPSDGMGELGWVLDRGAGVLSLRGLAFPLGRSNTRLEYRAGYEKAPADLKQAAIEQTANSYQQSGWGASRLGVGSRSVAQGSVNFTEGEFLPQVRGVLERYRNRSLL